jgi:adenylyltransferase/sulfurtransferase
MNDEQLLRYSRHLLLPEIDVQGQQKLLAARVLVVGLGGLGSAAVPYLAASGVGTLLLADGDAVELSNLQRQVLHTTARLGRRKTASAAEAVAALNPGVNVVELDARLEAAALAALLPGVDVALDCSDNYATRHALNTACFAARVPLVSAAALGWEGQLSVFDPRRGGPCYHCLHPLTAAVEERACAVNGVAAPVVGTLGLLQAVETLKLLTGAGTPLTGTLLVFDALAGEFHRLRLPARRDCPVCAPRS